MSLHTPITARAGFRRTLVGALLVLWAVGLAWAFWWYEAQYLRTFERPVFFSADSVVPPFEPGQVQVLHVWKADCPCSAGHQAYVNDMTERFSSQGVQFARSGQYAADALPAALKSLPYWPIPQIWDSWPGAPSVAIWNAEGDLAYVGPYSDGAHCSRDSSFIEPVISALLAGREVTILSQDTVACLCDIQ